MDIANDDDEDDDASKIDLEDQIKSAKDEN